MWTKLWDNVKAGVVGPSVFCPAHWFWVTSNNWMPALSNIQQCIAVHKAKPADLTLTRSVDTLPACVCVWWSVNVCVRASACLLTAAASLFESSTIEARDSLRRLRILARGLRGRAAPSAHRSMALCLSKANLLICKQTAWSLNIEEWTWTLNRSDP